MIEEVIGKGTWIDKVASNLLNREKKLGRNLSLIRVESGLGASGIPHIGSMGDAVRAYGIKLALENFGYKAELIAYSDDMDGLRKVPAGLPDWLQDYIAKPVSNIPDPFGGCHTSYGAHMSGLLLEGLDEVNVSYRFQSASEAYRKGMLAKETDIILRNRGLLGQKIAEYVGQKKYNEILPYFPVCESCGRLYVAKAEKYLPDENRVIYFCSEARIGEKKLKGCGYGGQINITKGEGKLAWKVEFAARWNALDIRFEAYGKDIMDSVRVNDWVADEILGYTHPLHLKYEMFLDKGGRKISKSAGNVLTPQMWLKYGTPESILLLLFKRITGTRHVGVDDIPVLMDEYDLYEDIYFDKVKENNQAKLIKLKGLYEYINHLKPPTQPSTHVPYRMLVQQAALFSSEERINKINDRLIKYGMIKHKSKDLKKRIELASNWANDHLLAEEKFEIEIKENHKKAIKELIETLKSFVGSEHESDAPKNLQSRIFNIARNNQMEPKEFFTLLYRMLLNTDRGPRLGNYALDLGINQTCNILERYIK
ncbi:MAG TPA: lysine--tRNA ligase [Nitrososphaeraceae archaeon]|nr:lysine--tRNA ligase [Nitrososphaeraceae archaeon]